MIHLNVMSVDFFKFMVNVSGHAEIFDGISHDAGRMRLRISDRAFSIETTRFWSS